MNDPKDPRKNRLGRRHVLRGMGGVMLGLPFLEGLAPRTAHAQDTGEPPYAFFLRQANGVAREQEGADGSQEPERFWPRNLGALNAANVDGRALDELGDYLDKLLVVGNVNMGNYDYADGHARGALQCLTARRPFISGMGGDSEANGESVDHRIGRQLNPAGEDSLFMYAGSPGGWLGGPCISYRGANDRRSALHNPYNAYESLIGGTAGLDETAARMLAERNVSVNDLVRDQLRSLLSDPRLSKNDTDRLELHLASIRDTELGLQCQMTESEAMALADLEEIYESSEGDHVLAVARAHIDIAVLAIACGKTRSVALQIGSGNDGSTTYRDPDTGQYMENFHYISHRRFSHGNDGGLIANADQLHHKVDRHFGQLYKYLLDKLSAYDLGGGLSLLDQGVSVWLNDLGSGPGHSARNCPFILAGGANGYFKQGQYVELDDGDWDTLNHARVLNTIASAVGCTSDGKDYCDDIGESDADRTPHPELQA